jgi:hypothetical protein
MSSKSCNGKDEHGNNCFCLRLIRRSDQQPDAPVICRDCGHTESAHPAPVFNAESIIAGYRDAAHTGVKSSLKASAHDAIKETTSGLKRRVDAESSEGPSTKKGKVNQSMFAYKLYNDTDIRFELQRAKQSAQNH